MKNQILNKYFFVIIYLCLVTTVVAQRTVETEVKPTILKKNESGSIVVEQIANSVYVRFYYTIGNSNISETRRYMNVTSILTADEFFSISEKIKNLGVDISRTMQKPAVEGWIYNNIIFVRELSPRWEPPRYEIKIDRYTFVYYPRGGTRLNIANYYLSTWNFDVPNYQEGNVYVRIVYDDAVDMMDKELLKTARIKVKTLKKRIEKLSL